MQQVQQGLTLSSLTLDLKRAPSLRAVSLTDQVYHHIRAEIIHGQLAPGVRLVEMEIAQRMGTSQGPVREALQRLEYEGLVERHARSATYVTQISLAAMYDIFSIRSMVEGCAVRQTAQQMTPPHYETLRSLVEQMRGAARRGDIVTLVAQDMEFHRCICTWCGNPTLLRVWAPLISQTERFVAQTHPRYFADLVEIADAHLPTLTALYHGDVEGAVAALREHIMLVWSRIQ
jgi:DNA-binding GntR family transcriptional regulator